MLTPRIIADMRAGDECADPDHPGLRVRRTNAARLLRRDLLPKLGDRAADSAWQTVQAVDLRPDAAGLLVPEAETAWQRVLHWMATR